jgi:hypothetical protein
VQQLFIHEVHGVDFGFFRFHMSSFFEEAPQLDAMETIY